MDAAFSILMAEISNAWADSREKKKKAKEEKKEAEARALAKASGLDESDLEVSTKAPETPQTAEEREKIERLAKSGNVETTERKELYGLK